MQCPKCRKDTPANQPYCIHCGQKMSISRDAVFAQAKAQVEHEKETWTAGNVRALLVYGVAFFLIGLLLFVVTRNPPIPRQRPAWPSYNPPVEAQAQSGAGTPADLVNGAAQDPNRAIPKTLIEIQPADELDEVPALTPETGGDE